VKSGRPVGLVILPGIPVVNLANKGPCLLYNSSISSNERSRGYFWPIRTLNVY